MLCQSRLQRATQALERHAEAHWRLPRQTRSRGPSRRASACKQASVVNPEEEHSARKKEWITVKRQMCLWDGRFRGSSKPILEDFRAGAFGHAAVAPFGKLAGLFAGSKMSSQ